MDVLYQLDALVDAKRENLQHSCDKYTEEAQLAASEVEREEAEDRAAIVRLEKEQHERDRAASWYNLQVKELQSAELKLQSLEQQRRSAEYQQLSAEEKRAIDEEYNDAKAVKEREEREAAQAKDDLAKEEQDVNEAAVALERERTETREAQREAQHQKSMAEEARTAAEMAEKECALARQARDAIKQELDDLRKQHERDAEIHKMRAALNQNDIIAALEAEVVRLRCFPSPFSGSLHCFVTASFMFPFDW